MNFLKISSAVIALCIASFVWAESVSDRVKPVGELCMSGEPCAAAAVVSGGEARDGETVYNTKCMACHATGAAGAPKLGDAADWAARSAERGIDGLYTSAISGFQGMPAKGLCMDCSDDELKAAVDYILENSK